MWNKEILCVNAAYPLGFLNIDIDTTSIHLHYTILRLLCVKHIYKNPHPPNIVHSSQYRWQNWGTSPHLYCVLWVLWCVTVLYSTVQYCDVWPYCVLYCTVMCDYCTVPVCFLTFHVSCSWHQPVSIIAASIRNKVASVLSEKQKYKKQAQARIQNWLPVH